MLKLVKSAALVISILAVTGCHCLCPEAARKLTSFDIVQMCDPQLGFGGYDADLGRFRQAAPQINALHPDLVFVCGDLVNAASPKSFGDFNAAKATLDAPCHCAPGNHDLGNTPTPKTLERYRRFVGKDYYAFQHKDRTFVVLDTQLWKSPVAGETERQDAWLKRTLKAARKRGQPVFVICHYLLFENNPDEPDSYYNLPLAKRKELLELFERSGVVALLAGHTHRTIIKEYHGIQMVTSETTSRNFDKRPFGFRVWHIGPARPYRHEFVPLDESAPTAPRPKPAGTAGGDRVLSLSSPGGEGRGEEAEYRSTRRG